MRAFLDFEASSLSNDSYPIEVAWVFEDGRSEGYLIRPAPQWTDWDEDAQAIHGIGRAELEARGVAHDEVARRMLQALCEHRVYASAPSWDGKWLSVLLRAAGLPRHAMRLHDTDEAETETAAEILGPLIAPEALDAVVAEVVEQARAAAAGRKVAHRALADAQAAREVWMEVRRLAAQRAG